MSTFVWERSLKDPHVSILSNPRTRRDDASRQDVPVFVDKFMMSVHEKKNLQEHYVRNRDGSPL